MAVVGPVNVGPSGIAGLRACVRADVRILVIAGVAIGEGQVRAGVMARRNLSGVAMGNTQFMSRPPAVKGYLRRMRAYVGEKNERRGIQHLSGAEHDVGRQARV